LPVNHKEGEHACVLQFQGEMDASHSGELKGYFLEAISHGKDLRVDLTAATDLDVTTLQLFWAAMREAEKTGRTIKVEGKVPAGVLAGICDAGFGPPLASLIPTQPAAISQADGAPEASHD
jgi:anti-anti-sigma regulatory factor